MHVHKSDGSIRVWGDYKAINECVEDDVYKLPNVQDIFAMRRLAKHNVKLNGAKCQFFQAQMKYMGHILSKQGIRPVKSKLDAIRLAS